MVVGEGSEVAVAAMAEWEGMGVTVLRTVGGYETLVLVVGEDS